MSLKQKTISGLTWSFIENFTKQGIVFIIGIILARLLTPREFGLIGMTTVFFALSESFIDSGFGQALVRKKNCTQADYSTVFYYNLFISIFLYGILFFTAAPISRFFDEPKLQLILQVLGLGLIFKSLSLIHLIRLVKHIDFKRQTKVTVIASIGSGIIGVGMAYQGYGVWSLVVKMLSSFALTSILLWFVNTWKPSLIFSKQSFKEMFSFGYKLLLSGLLDKAYNNVYYLVIGKYFSATALGFYTRADQFRNLPSQNLTVVIQRVSFPSLASIQDDIPRLKAAYQKLIRSTMLITFILMFGLAAMARPLVLTLIGEKWLPSVMYLQLLCFVGAFFPLQAINQNMLKVQGLSSLVLTLEVIKKIAVVPVILVGIVYGIKTMIVGMMLHAIVCFFMDSYYSGRLIGYSSLHQLKDILPSFLIAFLVAGGVYTIGYLINSSDQVKLILQGLIFVVLFIGICEITRIRDYLFIKQILTEKISSFKNRKQ